MSRSVTVIGAGPGGLAAAMLLARSGADVTILERRPEIGGRTGRIEEAGYRFDIGPTFFLYPRVIEEIFAACGRDLWREVEMTRLDPMYRVVFEAGGAIDATENKEELARQIAALSPRDAEALPRFMEDNRRKLAIFKPLLEAPFTGGWRDYLRPVMLRALPWMRPHRTVDQDLATFFEDERVRLAFSFQSKYLGMSPFRCPSLFTILSFMEHEYGVFHPKGGCNAVMDAMARIAQEMGVKIRTDEAVEEILFRGRRAVGVRTARGDEYADSIVLNADFANSMAKLVPNRLRRRWSDGKLANKRYSCSTFMLYLGIEGSIDNLAHHTVYLAENYRKNIDDIEACQAPPENPSFYLQNACVTDPSLAPPGHSTLYLLVPVGHQRGNVDWKAIAPSYRRMVLDRLERVGVTDIERRIRFEKMITPDDWRDDLAIYRGATFNLTHSLDQMLHRRPRNRFEDLENVYLVGGGTHPGSGLPVIFESARITTRLMSEDLGLTTIGHDLSRVGASHPAIARATP